MYKDFRDYLVRYQAYYYYSYYFPKIVSYGFMSFARFKYWLYNDYIK